VRAIELYRALFDFYPDAVDYGLELARTQTRASQLKEALATLALVDKQAPRAGDDPRLELQRLRVQALAGDFPAAAKSGARALSQARALGARQLVAEILLAQAHPLSMMGERAQARDLAAEASRIYDELGDPKGQADAAQRRASLASKAGELTESLALYDQAIATYRQVGADGRVAGVLNDRAGVLSNLGRRDEALRAYEEAITLARRVGDRSAELSCLINIGQQARHQRRYAESKARLEEALAQSRALGKKSNEGVVLESLGGVQIDLGDVRGAVEMEQQAIALYQGISDDTGVGNAKKMLAVALGLQGQDERALATFGEARAILTKLGEKTFVAHVEREQAQVEIARGRAAEAETQARAAVEALALAKAGPLEAEARGVLARALLAGGKTAEARRELDRALAGNDGADLQATAAAVELAEGHAAQAETRLTPLVVRTDVDRPALILARRVLAQAERAAGHEAKGAKREQAAIDDARALGLDALTRPLAWVKR
jgi:tetratricopeptide (TPR) repeat protein